MKKVIFFLLSFLVGIVSFYFVSKIAEWETIKEILSSFSFSKWLIIFFLSLCILLVEVWQWKYILKAQGYSFSFFSILEITFSSFAVGYLFPTGFFGGETFRVYFFRKRFNLPWTKSISTATIGRLLATSVIFLLLIICFLSFIFLTKSIPGKFIIFAFLLIVVLFLALSFFYSKTLRKESFIRVFLKLFRLNSLLNEENGKKFDEFEKDLFSFFELKKEYIWKGIAINFVKNIFVFLRCWVLVLFITGKANIFFILAIMFFLQVSYLFPLPAKLGSLDAGQVFVFSSLGFTPGSGITFSFLLRGVELIIALFSFFLLAHLGLRTLINSVIAKLKRFSS